MGLRVKFNLILLACLLLGLFAVFWLHKNAMVLKTEMDLIHQAETTFHITESIRHYNESEVSPLLSRLNNGFMPQTVGSYAASQTMADVQKTKPVLQYKVAIEKSDIQLYQPNIWQQNIINQFKTNPDLPLITTKVADADGHFLVYAKPISNNNQITGAKIVSINDTDVIATVHSEIVAFGLILLGLLLVIMLVLNVLLNSVILNPINNLSNQAQKISRGQSEADEIEVSGSHEIGQIAMSFNRMQRSLKAAMGMLS